MNNNVMISHEKLLYSAKRQNTPYQELTAG